MEGLTRQNRSNQGAGPWGALEFWVLNACAAIRLDRQWNSCVVRKWASHHRKYSSKADWPGSGTLTRLGSAFPVPRERLPRAPWAPGQSSNEFHGLIMHLLLDESVSELIFWPLFWKQIWYKKLLCFFWLPKPKVGHAGTASLFFSKGIPSGLSLILAL